MFGNANGRADIGKVRVAVPLSLILSLVCSSGCQTWQKHHLTAVQQYSSGDLDQSRQSLQKSRESVRSEQNVLTLDYAMIDLASGRTLEAENQLRTVRRELEQLQQKDLTEQTTSVLTDDRAIAYAGRRFEQQMALNVLLLTSLMGNGQDAFAYAQQASRNGHERRVMLAEAAAKQKDPASPNVVIPAGFEQSATIQPTISTDGVTAARRLTADTADQPHALAAYLSAAVQSESPLRHQETEAALRDIAFWNPQFTQLRMQSGVDGDFGTRCQPGHGTLHVIAFVGRAPEWVPESSLPTSASLLIADRILTAAGKHTLPPTIAAVKIARPEPIRDCLPPGLLHCRIGGELQNNSVPSANDLTFHSLVDLNAVAMADYHANRDHELARAVTRRVIKKGAVYLLKETQKIHRNTAVDLLTNVAGVAWEAMEKPDTRSWKLLPARVDVATTELPAGTWQTNLKCGVGSSAAVPVHIEDGRNTFVLCFIPQHRLSGSVLVGGADKGSFPVRISDHR